MDDAASRYLPGRSVGAGGLERTDEFEGRGEEVVEAASRILKTILARRRVAHFHSRLGISWTNKGVWPIRV